MRCRMLPPQSCLSIYRYQSFALYSYDKKVMQVLNNISTKNNRTVVVPIPKVLLQPHVWRGKGQDKTKILQAAVATVVPVLQEFCV